MTTKNKRFLALLLAVVMVASLFGGQILPTMAAGDVMTYLPVGLTVYQGEDADGLMVPGEYLYAASAGALRDGLAAPIEKHDTDFFVRMGGAIGNVFRALDGPGETIGSYLSGGVGQNPATANVPVIRSVKNEYLAGPYYTTANQKFYYISIDGNGLLEGPNSDDKTVILDEATGNYTVTPTPLIPDQTKPPFVTPPVGDPDVIPGVEDGRFYKEVDDNIYQVVNPDGSPASPVEFVYSDDAPGNGNDLPAKKLYGTDWYAGVGKNIFRKVDNNGNLVAENLTGALVGGGTAHSPNPAIPAKKISGNYYVGPFTDADGLTYYYGDGGNNSIDSSEGNKVGDDIQYWVDPDTSGLVTTKPVVPPTIGDGTIDLSGFNLPVVTGDTPVSVYNLQLKFVADGLCWQIIAIDKNGNCLITTTDANTNVQLIQKGSNGRFLTTTKNYSALVSKTVYEPSSIIHGYDNTVLNETMSTFYMTLADLKPLSLPALYNETNSLSAVSTTDVGRKYGCFALSAAETDRYFPDAASRIAKFNNTADNWWLRSTQSIAYAHLIRTDGVCTTSALSYNTGTRPAMWISLTGTPPVEMPSANAVTVNGSKIDLAQLKIPAIIGSATVSVWDKNLRFIAEGYCWQIIAVDKDGNCFVTTADAPKNSQLIQMDANGGYLRADKRYDALPIKSIYSSASSISDYKTSTLAATLGGLYNNFDELDIIDLPVVYANNGLSAVSDSNNPAARWGCFALSLDEVNTYLRTPSNLIARFGGNIDNWWLRSTQSTAYAHLIRTDGVNTTSALNYNTGARPAMWLDLG